LVAREDEQKQLDVEEEDPAVEEKSNYVENEPLLSPLLATPKFYQTYVVLEAVLDRLQEEANEL